MPSCGPAPSAVDVSGRTLGLAGFGRIGRKVARRALAFGMKVKLLAPTAVRSTGTGDELGELAGRVHRIGWDVVDKAALVHALGHGEIAAAGVGRLPERTGVDTGPGATSQHRAAPPHRLRDNVYVLDTCGFDTAPSTVSAIVVGDGRLDSRRGREGSSPPSSTGRMPLRCSRWSAPSATTSPPPSPIPTPGPTNSPNQQSADGPCGPRVVTRRGSRPLPSLSVTAQDRIAVNVWDPALRKIRPRVVSAAIRVVRRRNR